MRTLLQSLKTHAGCHSCRHLHYLSGSDVEFVCVKLPKLVGSGHWVEQGRECEIWDIDVEFMLDALSDVSIQEAVREWNAKVIEAFGEEE